MVKIEKTGIMSASGEINENLVSNFTDWYLAGGGWEVTTKDGYKCLHCSGEIGKGKYAIPKYSVTNATNYAPSAGEILTMSGYILMENIVLGDTNSYIYFYGSGKTIDGSWRGPSEYARTSKVVSHAGWRCFDPNQADQWTYVYVSWKYGDYDWTGICPAVYARDFSGDFYLRDFKIEINDHPTPWVPNELDDIYTGNINGFIETTDLSRIAEEYIEGNNFIEY